MPLPDFKQPAELGDASAQESPSDKPGTTDAPSAPEAHVDTDAAPSPAANDEEPKVTGATESPVEDSQQIETREYVEPTKDELGVLEQIAIEKILTSPFQPRLYFDEQSLEDLAENIREVGGLVEPIKVRPLADGRFELISVERRVRAYRINGAPEIPAWIKAMDDGTAFKEACAENLNREDLTLYEKAAAYKRALDEGHAKSQRALAVLSGVNRMDIQRCLGIFKLPPAAIKVIAANKDILALSHIEHLVDYATNGHGDLVAQGLELVSKDRLKRDMLISWIEKQAKPKNAVQTFHQYSLHGKPLGRMVIKSKKVSFNLDSEENSKLLVEAFEKAIASLGGTKG